MSFGGFRGPGEDFYTLPWPVLRFEPRQDADMLDLTEDQLRTTLSGDLERSPLQRARDTTQVREGLASGVPPSTSS